MGGGTEIKYEAPADPGVWYAPETLLWVALLLLGALALAFLLRFVSLLLLRNRVEEGSKAGRVVADAACRRSMLVIGLGFVLFCLVGPLLSALGLPAGSAVTVNTEAGLPAAVALLTIPSLALGATAIMVTLFIASFAAGVPGTGLLGVLWLFAGAVGCGFAAAFGGIAGPGLPIAFGTLAVIFLLLGFLRLQTHVGELTIMQRARRAETAAHRAEGSQAAATAPASGEYVGEAASRYWGRILGPAAFMPAGLLAMTLWMLHSGGPRAVPPVGFCLAVLGMGVAVSLVAFLLTARYAKTVTWDREGVTVTWYRGSSRLFIWEELSALKVVTVGTGMASVSVSSGEKWVASANGRGFADLVLALKAHVWTRADGEDLLPADSEQ